jgi:hypothetical protein
MAAEHKEKPSLAMAGLGASYLGGCDSDAVISGGILVRIGGRKCSRK